MTNELIEKAIRAYRFLSQIRNHKDVAGIHFIQDSLRIEIGIGHLYHQDLTVRVIEPREMISSDMSGQLHKILLEQEVSSNWIPVTDRLPNDGQECWTFLPDAFHSEVWDFRIGQHRFELKRAGTGGTWWVALDKGNTCQFEYHDYYENGDTVRLITHWQPLVRPEALGQ